MTVKHVEARSGAYADSVMLMQVSQRVVSIEGIPAVLVAMAAELNGLSSTAWSSPGRYR